MRIETGTWFARGAGFALGVGLVLALTLLAVRGGEVLLLVFLAVLLGGALEPVIGAIRERTGAPRWVGILIVYAGFLGVVAALAVFVVPAAIAEIGPAIGRLPGFLESVRSSTSTIRPPAVAQGISALIDAADNVLKPRPPSADVVVEASLAVGSAFAAVLTLLFLVFFWLTERPRLQRYALAFLPLDRREGVRDGWNEVEARLGLWVRGQLILMAALGVATGIAYSLIGLPGSLLLAVWAAVAEVIPMVGPLIGAVPALLTATTISPQTALVTLLVYLVLQLIEGNVLVPIVMRNSVGLSPFLVLVSILVGWTTGGPLGAIVAVPLVAGIEVVLERLQDRVVPVPVDPAAIRETEPPEREALKTAPDAPGAARRRRSATGSTAAASTAAASTAAAPSTPRPPRPRRGRRTTG
jgi:predicted PurR-regulated permease PerM